MADTKRPLAVFDDKASAKRAAKEVWQPEAEAKGYDVEVRPVTNRLRMSRTAGHYVQAGPYGIYLKERDDKGTETRK